MAKAKVEWIQEQERDTIKRISEALVEASKTWKEQENKRIKEHVDKAVKETEVRTLITLSLSYISISLGLLYAG